MSSETKIKTHEETKNVSSQDLSRETKIKIEGQTKNVSSQDLSRETKIKTHEETKNVSCQDLSSETKIKIEGQTKSRSEGNKKRLKVTLIQMKKTDHPFWDTQPVAVKTTKYDKCDDSNPFWRKKLNLVMNPNEQTGRIVSCEPEELLQESLKLPLGFEWIEVEIDALCAFLFDFYVTDPDANFRMSYSRETIDWVINPPGSRKDWQIGVIESNSKTLVATIIAIPSLTNVLKVDVPLVHIDFLCIRPSFRSNNLAPILIKEISRRVAITGILAATYTAAIELPHLITTSKCYHRPINMKKLIDLKFCFQHPKLTMMATLKHYSLPVVKAYQRLRIMNELDAESACELLNSHLKRYKIHTIFSIEDFKHYFLPRDNVVYSYVVERNDKIVNFASFYAINTIAVHSKAKDNIVRGAYLYYIVDIDIISNIINFASELKFDVFNCMDLMSNDKFIQPCKFIVGTGKSNYYFYNWKCPKVDPSEMAVVIV